MRDCVKLSLCGAWLVVGTLVLVFFGSVSLSGCSRPGFTQSTIAVTGHVPSIDLPEKPQLINMDADELVAYNALPEGLRNKLRANDRKLKVYAVQMKVAIEDYNAYAAAQNKKSDESVGVKKTGK